LSTTAEGNGIILLDWLRLLGWTVEIERDGDDWVGLARRIEPTGAELRVGGCATGLTRLVWDLFTGAVERLDGRREQPVRPVLRAA
jgi:hypothetical protein